MATGSLAISVTKSADFHTIPNLDLNVFSVLPGVDANTALGIAGCLDAGVQDVLTESINEGSMGANQAWLCRFAIEAAAAIRRSLGVEA